MKEALLKRLRQLYPEPPCRYLEERLVRPPGLRPDIFVQHPDGKKWAFEMVHRNSQATHLLENHRRYLEAGIQDIWILWQDLEPSAGRPRSIDQGVMPRFLSEQRLYKLGAPQRAILDMQEGEVRTLYAFTVNTLGTEARAGQSSFSTTTRIGITVYKFEGWAGQKRYPAQDAFVALHEIEFAEGSVLTMAPPEANEWILETLADQYGLSGDMATVVPSEAIEQFDQLPALIQRDSRELVGSLLSQHLASLSPEEMQEILSFFRSGGVAQQTSTETDLPEITVDEALGSGAAMGALADGIQRVIQQLQDLGMPKPLLEFVLQWLDPHKLAQVAELMQWQEESENLRDVRQGH
jgi:hypothetical protein